MAMMIVENQPRLTIRELQEMPEWPHWAAEVMAEITACWDGISVHVNIPLDTTELTFGRRWWCICPCCSARRYSLIWLGAQICCRGCAGNPGGGRRLLYFQQSMSKRFREEKGLLALRAWRRAA